jgi:hypothetical protein
MGKSSLAGQAQAFSLARDDEELPISSVLRSATLGLLQAQRPRK